MGIQKINLTIFTGTHGYQHYFIWQTTEGKWHLVGSSDWEPAKEIFNGTLRLKKDAGIHVLKDDFTVDHTEISAEELIGQYAEYGMDDSLDIFEKAYFCDFTLELNEEGEIVDLTENWKC